MAQTKPDYGVDTPSMVEDNFSRGGWALALALGVWWMNRAEYPDVSMRILLILGSIGVVCLGFAYYMLWSSRQGKLIVRDALLDGLQLRGDEKVLDVGCGRGLLAIGAAKRLKSGRVTALDIFDDPESLEVAQANAKLEGGSERIKFESGDALKLGYGEAAFDVVVSSLALHHFDSQDDRAQAVREMFRVVKPGGRLCVYDTSKTAEYAATLQAVAKDVAVGEPRWLWCVPSRAVTASK